MTTERISKLSELITNVQILIDRGDKMSEKVEDLHKVVLIGNGKPSLRAQVARHDDWINNANRLIWILVTAAVGQFIASMCTMLVFIIGLFWQWGVLRP